MKSRRYSKDHILNRIFNFTITHPDILIEISHAVEKTGSIINGHFRNFDILCIFFLNSYCVIDKHLHPRTTSRIIHEHIPQELSPSVTDSKRPEHGYQFVNKSAHIRFTVTQFRHLLFDQKNANNTPVPFICTDFSYAMSPMVDCLFVCSRVFLFRLFDRSLLLKSAVLFRQ